MVQETIANRIILHRHFKDIDELAEVLNSGRKVQLTQLSPRRFNCDLFFVEFEEAQFFFTNSFGSVRCLGEKNAEYLSFSCVIESSEADVITHGYRVSDDTLYGFDPNREINLVMPSNLKLCNVSIKCDVFEECLRVMERTDIDRRFLSANFLRSPTTMPTLRNYLKQLWCLVERQPHFLKLPHLKKLVLEDFIPLLIDAIPLSIESALKPLPSSSRVQTVKQVEDYMMAHLDRPLTLKDLGKALNVSSRPIFYGFQEMFGVSPMAYLKVQRLHGVRRALKVSDPETRSVMEIAQQFGFWSAGHFARDYKTMFGDLPSETLKQ